MEFCNNLTKLGNLDNGSVSADYWQSSVAVSAAFFGFTSGLYIWTLILDHDLIIGHTLSRKITMVLIITSSVQIGKGIYGCLQDLISGLLLTFSWILYRAVLLSESGTRFDLLRLLDRKLLLRRLISSFILACPFAGATIQLVQLNDGISDQFSPGSVVEIILWSINLICITFFAFLILSNCFSDLQNQRFCLLQTENDHCSSGESFGDIQVTVFRMKALIMKIITRIQSHSSDSELLHWVQTLKTRCDELDSKFGLQERKVNAFFIVNPSPSEATSKFITALKAKVKLMPMGKTSEIEDTSEDDRILVICSVTSRIECNLDVIKDINPQYYPRIILILLHCHACGNLPASSNFISKAKKQFPGMQDVIEMAFNDSIYRCSMNTKALRTLGAKRNWLQMC